MDASIADWINSRFDMISTIDTIGENDKKFFLITSAINEDRVDVLEFIIGRDRQEEYALVTINVLLSYSAHSGKVKAMKWLIDNGADVNARNVTKDSDQTPVFCAAINGHVEAIKLLKEHGADINARNDDGVTPLGMAIKNSHIEAAEYLRANGALER